jgi:hypothetical protein
MAAATPDCPSADEPLSVAQLVAIVPLERLACFGSRYLKVNGLMTCAQWIVDAPAFVNAPWDTRPDQPYSCTLDGNDNFILDGDIFKPWVDGTGVAREATLTGHFDDPRSRDCRWGQGDYANFVPDEGGPSETAILTCRLDYVVTDVSTS